MYIENGQPKNVVDPSDNQDAMTYKLGKEIPRLWENGVRMTEVKEVNHTGTTTTGQLVIYLTENGASDGAAIFPNQILHANVFVSDPNNTFGVGYAITNSNKTLTITVNVRTFGGVTILGIPVLGSTTLAAAPDGTPVGVHIIGR